MAVLKVKLDDTVRAKLGSVCRVRKCSIEELALDALTRTADELTTRAPITAHQSTVFAGNSTGTTINNYNILSNLKLLSENAIAPVVNFAANISWRLFPESVPKDIGATLAIGFVLGAASVLARLVTL